MTSYDIHRLSLTKTDCLLDTHTVCEICRLSVTDTEYLRDIYHLWSTQIVCDRQKLSETDKIFLWKTILEVENILHEFELGGNEDDIKYIPVKTCKTIVKQKAEVAGVKYQQVQQK